MKQDSVSWQLCRFQHKSERADGVHAFVTVRDATFQEVDDVRMAIRHVDSQLSQEALELVEFNLTEFQETEDSFISAIETRPQAEWFAPGAIRTVLRMHFLNWLLSARVYLDHSETRLKQRYGNESLEVEAFREITSEQYDSYFSYRFLYKLRNYAAHHDFPLNGGIYVDVNETPSRWIEIFFDKAQLLEGFRWGSIRAEIERMPDEIHLADHMEQMMIALHAIVDRITEVTRGSLMQDIQLLSSYWEEIGRTDDMPCFVQASNEGDGMSILWIPFRPTGPAPSVP